MGVAVAPPHTHTYFSPIWQVYGDVLLNDKNEVNHKKWNCGEETFWEASQLNRKAQKTAGTRVKTAFALQVV